MIKAVIFDVDGTLIDSVDCHAEAWRTAFAEFGYHIAFEDLRRQIGKGGDQLLPVFLSEDDVERVGSAIEARRAEIVKTTYLPVIKGFPGVRALFQKLQTDGIAIVLASSAKGEELASYKSIAGIDDLVGTETTSDDAERSKPHGDFFQAALDRLDGIDRQDVLVVGDTPYDAEATAKVGLRTVGVLCGGFPEGLLREAGCIEIAQDPVDLLERCDRIFAK